jgi:hypothetical protein
MRQEHVPQPGLARDDLQLVDHRDRLPRIAGAAQRVHLARVPLFVG